MVSDDVVYAVNFSRWKRPTVQSCFRGSRVVFTDRLNSVPAGARLAVWGMFQPDSRLAAEVQVIRLEDGFLRSVGLGADLIRPLSWVVDAHGIYYDATKPSDLEFLLSQSKFDYALLERAGALRERIVAAGITKYNVGTSGWSRKGIPGTIILVPGQVESDESLKYGAPGLRTNIDILRAVREANPNAYVIYKPHPDVMAGLRAWGTGEACAVNWCDEIVTDVEMSNLLREVDEVHVLTSLTGFEALLRAKPVTCYGQPFYSGWGLTSDILANPRRSRRLSLDELVAGALIQYPLYFSGEGDELITPEQALDELREWRARTGGSAPWWREIKRQILRKAVGVR